MVRVMALLENWRVTSDGGLVKVGGGSGKETVCREGCRGGGAVNHLI